jgi:hypothetical protein
MEDSMSKQPNKHHEAEIEEALGWNWTVEPAAGSDGESVLTIKELPGFFFAHHDKTIIREEMGDALRAELRAYQLTGRALPRPEAKKTSLADVVFTMGGGSVSYGIISGFALPKRLELRQEPQEQKVA